MKIRTPRFFRSTVKISVLGALFSMEKQSDALIILFVQLITGIASVFTSCRPRVEAVVVRVELLSLSASGI